MLNRILHAALVDLERDIDRIGGLLAAGEERDRKVRIAAFAGYRNHEAARIKGRILRWRTPPAIGAGSWSRFRAMLELYNSHELGGIEVRCRGYGQDLAATTDEEGYFDFELPVARPLPPRAAWEDVRVSTPGREAQEAEVKVPVIAPGTSDHWGIISDIDDTVIETGATDFVKNWRRVLVDQPDERIAVPGAPELYRLIAEDHVAPVRPFFYVSSSPWNLYGFLTEFMALNGIPHGPMFLKDYGIDRTKFVKTGHDTHKLAAIETILAFYPGTKFLLIGDNGQEDVAIYAKAVEHFPRRVAGVFIRDVNGSCREGEKASLLARIGASGVPTSCGAGFEDAIEVARSLGLDRPIETAKAVGTPAGA
jgi:phosphatidate phosphatase APP1